jgi:hypothetical protein
MLHFIAVNHPVLRYDLFQQHAKLSEGKKEDVVLA